MESDTSDAKRLCASEVRLGKRLYESDARPTKGLCVMEDEFANYDVFISHRGPDTKTGFVGFLYEALKRVGLHPFLDCKSIGKGQDSWKCISHAIQTTPLALVIFSESFVQSEWCLKELHAILNSPSMKVLPIFYNIEPWEVNFPEKGQLAVGFTKLIARHDTIVMEEWRANLKRASKLNGWEHKVGDKRLEVNLVLEVVDKIFEMANKPLPLHVGDHIVGVKEVAERLIQALIEKRILLLGLWGMGGIGKSTLAKELYNQLGQRFDARCYVEDVAEKVNQGGLTTIQNHILKALCEEAEIIDKSRGKIILEERLFKKRVLVVLDDVRDDEMDYLMSRQMLKEGSMCIVTSRNRCVFEKSTSFHAKHEVHTHDVQLLSEHNSRSVFACHAFGSDGEVPLKFKGLVGDVSMACGGVPLVLKVCGSLLRYEEDVEIWEEVLKKLGGGHIMDEKKIFECLHISFDSLRPQHQEMFLDIACALLGQSIELAKLFWKSQGWCGALGVRSLMEKALIRVDEHGAFCMHNHLRDMGRTIANKDMCKRLWGLESLALLKKNELQLDSLQTLNLPWRHGIGVDLSLMKRLRMLKCEDSLFLMSSLPENLRWLHFVQIMDTQWRPFPEALEDNELVILFWSDPLLKNLPESLGNLSKLKVLNLSWCDMLKELPDSLQGLQNLENLNLERSGICSLPQSFGTLSKLKVLNLVWCDMLQKLPDSLEGLQNLEDLNLEGSGIRSLPPSFGSLSKLKLLNLAWCHKLKELPNSLESLQNLENLNLERTGIGGLPPSFGSLSMLKLLNLAWCHELKELPNSLEGLQNLENLNLKGSGIQGLPPSFGTLSKLKVMNLACCHELKELPNSLEGLQNLEDLNLEKSGIRTLSPSFGSLRKLKLLNLVWCPEFKELPNSLEGLQNLEDLNLEKSGIQGLSPSFGSLSKLKVMNLACCHELKELPNSLEGLQNLEDLNLEKSGIRGLPPSFGSLRKLKLLNLAWCPELKKLPDSLEGLQNLEDLNLQGSGIRGLPPSFGTLNKLKVMNLESCLELKELPNSLEGLENLKNLNLEGSGIRGLPPSLGTLSKLKLLNLAWCRELKELPNSLEGLQNLEDLNLKRSGIQGLPPSFGTLSKLKLLNLGSCRKLKELPNSLEGLQILKNLNLKGSGIRRLPPSFGSLRKLKLLNLAWCPELKKLPDSLEGLENLKNLNLKGSGIQGLPPSLGTLNKLKVMNLEWCRKLKELPDLFEGFKNLEDLKLEGCGSM